MDGAEVNMTYSCVERSELQITLVYVNTLQNGLFYNISYSFRTKIQASLNVKVNM
jgi:hypothetical protein